MNDGRHTLRGRQRSVSCVDCGRVKRHADTTRPPKRWAGYYDIEVTPTAATKRLVAQRCRLCWNARQRGVVPMSHAARLERQRLAKAPPLPAVLTAEESTWFTLDTIDRDAAIRRYDEAIADFRQRLTDELDKEKP